MFVSQKAFFGKRLTKTKNERSLRWSKNRVEDIVTNPSAPNTLWEGLQAPKTHSKTTCRRYWSIRVLYQPGTDLECPQISKGTIACAYFWQSWWPRLTRFYWLVARRRDVSSWAKSATCGHSGATTGRSWRDTRTVLTGGQCGALTSRLSAWKSWEKIWQKTTGERNFFFFCVGDVVFFKQIKVMMDLYVEKTLRLHGNQTWDVPEHVRRWAPVVWLNCSPYKGYPETDDFSCIQLFLVDLDD